LAHDQPIPRQARQQSAKGDALNERPSRIGGRVRMRAVAGEMR